MDHNNSKEKEVIVDIEIDEASREPGGGGVRAEWGKKSSKKLVSGVLGFNGLSDTEEYPNETTELLADECDQGNVEKKKSKKASKPPRPPRGPSLDASDMRLIKEISKIAIKKRERNERMKALKKMKAANTSPSSSSSSAFSSSSSLLSASTSTISAMIITVLFCLVLLFQGLGSSTRLNMRLTGVPKPEPETRGLTHVEFYKTVSSDNGAAPSSMPPQVGPSNRAL